MATLIGDFPSDHTRHHHHIMSTPSNLSYPQQRSHDSRYRSTSRPHDAPARRHDSPVRSAGAQVVDLSQQNVEDSERIERPTSTSTPTLGTEETPNGPSGSLRFPTPPNSSSPSVVGSGHTRPQRERETSPSYTTSTEITSVLSHTLPESSASTVLPSSSARPSLDTIPSPASEDNVICPPPTQAPHTASPGPARQPRVICINDLAHVQQLAQLDMITGNGPGILHDPPLQEMKYEISGMPIADIIEMVAALLTKITTTNDLQHDALNRNANHQRQAQAQNEGSDIHSSPFSTSVLAFHGKNVPAITILSYLSRIHKYCPTTYEVFLSLLVYFDRMTERVNDIVMKDEETRRDENVTADEKPAQSDVTMSDGAGDETDEDLADSDDDNDGTQDNGPERIVEHAGGSELNASSATYFVVDSFNIHRLIIAGVTCASKFFSDVFYTNSRYAKVGGLPLAELNHLELQFLLLNDFRLAVPVEDLEAYATMLVEFYAREVVAQRSRPAASASSSES